MNGKIIRMNRIINPITKRALIIKANLMMETLSAEDLIKVSRDFCDGIILNLEQVEKLFHYFLGRHAPALILKIDYTSYSSSLIENALYTGASGVISSFIVGHKKDEDEAKNLEAISSLARESERYALPLIVECIPFGERITKENFFRCVELAARVSAEAGADIIAVPYIEGNFLRQKIVNGIDIPVLMSDMRTFFGSAIENAEIMLKSGASGFLIGEETFRMYDISKINYLYSLLHGEV
jgi:DhnA family fructose-bisphosphate aldolase class Ia